LYVKKFKSQHMVCIRHWWIINSRIMLCPKTIADSGIRRYHVVQVILCIMSMNVARSLLPIDCIISIIYLAAPIFWTHKILWCYLMEIYLCCNDFFNA
jgi:hypothetical protein